MMEDALFALLLEWLMVSDPWVLSEDKHDAIKFVLNTEAENRGYENWVVAYHEWRHQYE